MNQNLTIEDEQGDAIVIALSRDGTRDVGRIFIDGVPYHIERIKAVDLQREYNVDNDATYTPQHDRRGKCVIVAPYSKP